MKTAACLILVFSVLLSPPAILRAAPAPAADGLHVETHANGKPKLKESYKGGKLDGLRQTFDEKGALLSSETYRAGLRHGPALICRDGKPQRHQTWVEDMLAYPQSKSDIQTSWNAIKSLKIDDQGLGSGQVAGLRRLMTARVLAGVPWQTLRLDAEWARKCKLAARSNELLGKLDHFPTRPAGMSDADFQDAYEACGHSNLHWNTGKCHPLDQCIDGWLRDDGDSNKERLGHRRWCLSQNLGATAFGVSGGYSAMWCFDKSGDLETYQAPDAISWPVHGYHAKEFASPGLLWHVSLNPEKFKQPETGKVKVELRPISGAFTGIDKAMKAAPLPLDWLHVDNSKIGLWKNAIVFHPKNFTVKGSYLVVVTGLTDAAGQPASHRYLVEFF
ncbi:MAG: hypothetical protein RL095_3689 [Verrucomicrobiota bacterium]|jgi:hypothetical protein